jgi:DNA-binding transcriptional MerR regulator
MRSGELSRLAGVSADTLRHYERLGILPKPPRTGGGYRNYPANSLNRVRLIQSALNVGFSLSELMTVLKMRDCGQVPCYRVRAIAERKLQDLKQQIRDLSHMRDQLEQTLAERIKEELGDIPLSTLVQDQQPVADFITKLVKDSYGAKTIKNYFGVIKMVVASAKDKATRKPLYPVAWDNDVLLMPRVNAKKQNRPTFTDKQVSQIVERAEGQYKVLFAVLAASGLRISELLGLRIENVLDDCYRLRIIEKNYAGRQEDRLKTVNAERIVELHSTAAQLLRSHIHQCTSGFVFENKKHNAPCATNILKRYLHPILLGSDGKTGVTGQKAGEHAFRRYRDGYLRTQGCPAGLLKYWLGHSRTEDMSDLYDGSMHDEAYRMEMAEKLGTGFDVASCTDCTEKEKEATGAVASK